jgi:hypothetical protein
MTDFSKTGAEDLAKVNDLHNKKRQLYMDRQSRKISGTNWSEEDENAYNTKIIEINAQITDALKQAYSKSSIKAKIEADIRERLLKAGVDKSLPTEPYL